MDFLLKTRTIKLLFLVFVFFAGIHSVITVFHNARLGYWDYDAAIYVQPALSMSQTFMYATFTKPAVIHSRHLTANGPMQYVMAPLLASFDIETARIIFVTGVFAILWLAVFYYSPPAALVASYLLYGWSVYYFCATRYWGEISAVTFCMLGIIFYEKALRAKAEPIWGSVLFGFALCTKLVTFALVPCLMLYCIERVEGFKPVRMIYLTARSYLIALGTLVGFYYFSVAHSLLAAKLAGTYDSGEVVWPGFISFITFPFSLERSEVHLPRDPWHIFENGPWLFVFLLAAGLVGAYRYRGLLLLAVGYLAILMFAHLYEKRVFPYLFCIIILGSAALASFVQEAYAKGRKFRAAALVALYLAALIIPTRHHAPALAAGLRPGFLVGRIYSNKTWYRGIFGKLYDLLPYAEFPVLVYGIEMFPDLGVATNVKLYNLLDPVSVALANKAPKSLFLFRNARHEAPDNPYRYCRKILVQEFDNVLCELNRDEPVGIRPY